MTQTFIKQFSAAKVFHSRDSRGFTLVELLVVIGIIAILLALLMPTLSGARRQAQSLRCAGNLHQITVALFEYAATYKGCFPPNVSSPQPQSWYDADRIGRFMRIGKTDMRGAAITCPADADAQRSYAMNGWASCLADLDFMRSPYGRLWKQGVHNSSQLILVAEAWSGFGSALTGWKTQAEIGFFGETPGPRFGAAGGLVPQFFAGRFNYVNCELPYQRHRQRGDRGTGTEPFGRVNIGYADGHVALKTDHELAQAASGLSTLDTWWSPMDDRINKPRFSQ